MSGNADSGAPLIGTHREPSEAVSVERCRLGIPGEPGENALRLVGSAACSGEIVLTDPSAVIALMEKLRRSLLHIIL